MKEENYTDGAYFAGKDNARRPDSYKFVEPKDDDEEVEGMKYPHRWDAPEDMTRDRMKNFDPDDPRLLDRPDIHRDIGPPFEDPNWCFPSNRTIDRWPPPPNGEINKNFK